MLQIMRRITIQSESRRIICPGTPIMMRRTKMHAYIYVYDDIGKLPSVETLIGERVICAVDVRHVTAEGEANMSMENHRKILAQK